MYRSLRVKPRANRLANYYSAKTPKLFISIGVQNIYSAGAWFAFVHGYKDTTRGSMPYSVVMMPLPGLGKWFKSSKEYTKPGMFLLMVVHLHTTGSRHRSIESTHLAHVSRLFSSNIHWFTIYTHVAETYNKGESELHTHCKENAQIMWSLFACTKVVDRDFYIHGPNLCLYVVAIFIRGVQFFACRNGCGFVRANSVCTESAAASSSSHSVSVGSFSGHHHDALGCAVRPTRHQCLSEWRRNGAGWERALFVFEQHKHTERIQRLANGVVPCHWCFFWSDRDNKTHTHR